MCVEPQQLVNHDGALPSLLPTRRRAGPTHLSLPHPRPPPLITCRFSLASEMLAEPSIFESYVYGAQWMMKPFK